MFVNSTNISDYLEAITGRDEFNVSVKGDYTVINYAVMMADTFPDPATAHNDTVRRNFILRRDCRGIIFSTATGAILRRPYHKFFNAGEREETQFHKVDFTKSHVILEKLDGCLSERETVETPIGQMTLKDFAESVTDLPIKGYDHTTKSQVWCEVTGISIQESADNWNILTLDDGRSIQVTDNHKIWCVNKNKYVRVSDLDEGDEVLDQ